MVRKSLSIPEIRKEGLQALRERLGIAGMIQFLRLYNSGSGDYSRERHEWLDSQDFDEVVQRIKKRQRGDQIAKRKPAKKL